MRFLKNVEIKAGLFCIFLAAAILFCTSFTTQPSLANTSILLKAATSYDGEGEAFPLTLNQSINLALQANRGLITSNFGLDSQTLTLHSSESAFDFTAVPQFNAGVTDSQRRAGAGIAFQKRFNTGIETSIIPRIVKVEDEYSGEAGVSLKVPLLKGYGRDVNLDSVQGSRFSVRSSERFLFSAKVNVVVDTVSAVYAIIRQEELVDFYTIQAEKMEAHAAKAQMKEKVGLATPMDILRAEIRLKDIESSLAAAREALVNAEDRLKLILALPLKKRIAVTAPLSYEVLAIDLDEVVETALANRVELAQYEDDIAEARRRSLVSKNGVLPQLDLVMDYGRYDDDRDFIKSMALEEERWSVFIEGAMDWKRTQQKNSFEQSLLSIRSARLNYNVKKDDIVREVRYQLESLKKAEENIRIRMQQRHQTEGKLAMANIKFNHGMTDNFDVIEAETDYLRASVDLLTAETAYIVGTYRMRSAMGTLIEREH